MFRRKLFPDYNLLPIYFLKNPAAQAAFSIKTMNIFSFFTRRRKERNALADVKHFSSAFAHLNSLRDSGLLLWQERNRRLFIMQPLAIIMMRNADSWRNFLTNCYLWQSYALMLEAHEHAITRLEGEAIREAKKQFVVLTKADMERIRRSVRDEYEASNTPAKIEPFDFYVIADNPHPIPRTEEQDAEQRGDITLVGSFNPETGQLEQVPWKELRVKNYES